MMALLGEKIFMICFLSKKLDEKQNSALFLNHPVNLPRYRTTKLQKYIKYHGVKVWNSIPQEIRSFFF